MMLLFGVIVLVVIITYLVLNFYPPLGKTLPKNQRQRYSRSSHYDKDKFVNLIPSSIKMTLRENVKLLVEFVKGNRKARPAAPLSVEPLSDSYYKHVEQQKLTWFGHSTILMQIDGKTILIDPMLGQRPSPVSFVGGKRFSSKLPVEIEQMPAIDIMLISHDHYDHLDYGTIVKLKDKVKQFHVPLGVSAHLESWGVSPDRIEEHNWWDEFECEGLKLACTPARHFSGRSLVRDVTLWCSWVINGQEANIFFSGDSGYGPHFKEIGAKYGPFDLTMMECGQYDERWAAIHMLPEQTVQAHMDVKGKVLIPIHWGAFTLSMHDWTEPVERAVTAAKKHKAQISTPKIGETVRIGASEYPSSTWWK